MSGARPPAEVSRDKRWARLPLEGSVLLLCAIGLLGAARTAGFPWVFVAAFAVIAALRLTVLRDGRAFLPRRPLRAFALAMGVVSLAWLFSRLAAKPAQQPLADLMAVIAVFQGLVLISRRTVFGSFLLILFSSVHAAVTAVEFKDGSGLAWTLAYVAVLVWTLLLFERRAAYSREAGGSGAVVLVRPEGGQPLPMRVVLTTTALLVLLGFPLGALLYLAMPPVSPDDGLDAMRAAAGSSEYAGEDVPGKEVVVGAGPDPITAAFTGPGKGVPLGSVAEIKRDITPWFEVQLHESSEYPPLVVLRDNIQDHCRNDGLWTDTLSPTRRDLLYMDGDDGRQDGWVPLGRTDVPGSAFTIRITNLRGGHRRLYLQPDAIRMKLLRDDRSRSGYSVRASRNETLEIDYQIKAADVVVQRCVPQVRPGTQLTGRRSQASVVKWPGYLQMPDRCKVPLTMRSREIVGDETDPWKRAKLLEGWLNSEAFEYTLKAPPLKKFNPIVDFVENTRSGSCTYYATALTLMLRSLGHPARYVRGFWGGDRLEYMPSVMLRGYHYHAWTEMFLEGVGWVPLNPTPPDRRAADGGTTTAAQALEDEETSFSLLFYDAKQWGRLWSSAGAWIGSHVLEPIATLFRPQAAFAGYPMLLLFLLMLHQGRERARLKRMVAPDGRKLPPGPYGQALLLLARKGARRRPSWTAREFGRYVARRFPDAAQPFLVLTRVYEQERFGGRPEGRAGRTAANALNELRRALAPKPAESAASTQA